MTESEQYHTCEYLAVKTAVVGRRWPGLVLDYSSQRNSVSAYNLLQI